MAKDYEIARARMVKEQLRDRGISDERVIKAMNVVPRHLFVEQAFWPSAYGEKPLPIGFDQTISHPFIVGLMSQSMNLSEGAKVLEIGTGSGYQAAVLALMGCKVFTIERHEKLAQKAENVIRKLKIENISFRVGDGSIGWKEKAPFDGIVVTAGAPDLPDSLMDQLATGASLVIPVGTRKSQRLVRILKGKKMIDRYDMGDCSFVPLIGSKAWESEALGK